MNKKINSSILTFFMKNAGKSISFREFDKFIKKELNPSNKGKRKITRKKQNEMDATQDPMIIVAELELLGIITIKGRSFRVKEPFLLTGKTSLNPRGIAFITVQGADPLARDIFIAPSDTKGALPGDEVIVRLKDRKRERFEGYIVNIAKRARKFYRMKLLSKSKQNAVPGFLLDTPGQVSACIMTNRIPSDMLKKIKGDVNVIVKLTGKQIMYMGSHMHEAEFIRFESDSDQDPDFERVAMKYNLDPVYPGNIHLPEEKEITEEKISSVIKTEKRKDLRDLYTVTIDGDDSKDFDDAITILKEKRKIRLYVHIADVAYYVKKDSPLDKEAQRRSTSVYLPGRVIPMLPPVLSENLCSLVQDTNRLAFTAEMSIDPKSGKITDSKFYRSVIRVNRRLTYKIAEKELDEALQNGKETDLSLMWEISTRQKKLRIKEGRIDLNIKESKIKTDDNNEVSEIETSERLKSSMIIEEFMLSANTAVAQFLRKKNAKVLYRVHEAMDEGKVETLNTFFKIYNIPFEMKNNKPSELHKALKTAAGDPVSEKIFNMLLLRSFMQANYRPQPAGHWGLGFKDYCHFTSPIRRYPDLVVHRVLAAVLNKEKQVYGDEEIHTLGMLTSDLERKAMDAERDMVKLKVIRHIERTGKKEFKGFITGFRTDRIFLELEDYPIEAVVAASHLTNDAELILPDRFSAYIKKFSRPAFLGEEWNLVIDRYDYEEIRLYFKPAPGFAPTSVFK
ncbi:MAG: ribonuclease R [Spirochaetia bacterium]|nr:ribonuclease R [Spirochaetia bacterium]